MITHYDVIKFDLSTLTRFTCRNGIVGAKIYLLKENMDDLVAQIHHYRR